MKTDIVHSPLDKLEWTTRVYNKQMPNESAYMGNEDVVNRRKCMPQTILWIDNSEVYASSRETRNVGGRLYEKRLREALTGQSLT